MRTSSTGSGRLSADVGTGRPAGRLGRGFTLVELTVVIIVVSVLAAMIAPRLYSSTGSARLRDAAGGLLVGAQYARDFAVTRRCACWLVIDPDEHCYELAYQQDRAHLPGELRLLRTGIGKAERLGKGIRFERIWIERRGRGGTSQEVRSVRFNPTGTADAAVLAITDGRQTYSVLVAPNTARALLVEGAVNELPNDRVDLDE